MSLVPSSSAIETGGYTLSRSLRFRASASAYLNRTPASAGNRRTWTRSYWVKRGASSDGTGSYHYFLSNAGAASNEVVDFYQNTIRIYFDAGLYLLQTTQVFRDYSGWYNIVVAVDTTQATDTNRIKLYVNGSQVTAFSTAVYPPQNYDCATNNTVAHYIAYNGSTNYYDGYLTEINHIDGQALTPSSFGQTDATSGAWIPKRYGGSYGTNGFYLPFTNTTSATTLCYDSSGNGNNWTPNNISTTAGATYDSMTDVPTLTSATAANFATLNPLSQSGSLAQANLYMSNAATSSYYGAKSTQGISVSNSKTYFEVVVSSWNNSGSTWFIMGMTQNANLMSAYQGQTAGSIAYAYKYGVGQQIANETTAVRTDSGIQFVQGDILQCAYDPSTGKLWFGKNNAWFDSGSGTTGSPSTGANQTLTASTTSDWFPFIQLYTTSYTEAAAINFGQRPFSYTPPTGFKALNTYNLPTPTIPAGNKYMDATLYTGTGSNVSITNAGGFQPDLVMLKCRSNAQDNPVYDSVRGPLKEIYTDLTNSESSEAFGLSSFNSNGFSLTSNRWNNSGYTFVGWQWKAGGTAVTNTTGSTSCQLSASPSSGFSIATFTPPASGTSFTIGHGLGVAPQMIITKIRNNAVANWFVYNEAMGNTGYMALNATNGNLGPYTPAWNNTSPTSSVATFGSYWIGSSYNMVAYFFTSVNGFSKFGSYTGNGSADGPFVYCGFRPKYVMVKRTDATYGWFIEDTSCNPYNVQTRHLRADLSDAEITAGWNLDTLSNGFKIRESGLAVNANGGTYIFMAFAENPFKYANAR